MEENASVAEVLAALTASGYSKEDLASTLGVSFASVQRWSKGLAQPRPNIERDLRQLSVGAESVAPEWSTASELDDRAKGYAVVAQGLSELREAYHRRGRMSSRNDALDEVSKLLFVHFSDLFDGGHGISRGREGLSNGQVAAALKRFVDDAITQYLPASLSHEIGPEDFALLLKPSEDALAEDIVAVFDTMASKLVDVSPDSVADIMNGVFGNFLADSFADEKQLGQYLTPTEIVAFMVRLALVDLDEQELQALTSPDACADFGLVLDPSCGVGSFLAEFLRQAGAISEGSYGDAGRRSWLETMSSRVVGLDKSERMIRLALTNMASFGLDAVNLHCVNSLELHGHEESVTNALKGQCGLIITNPPFGAEFSGCDLDGYRIAGEWTSRSPRKVDSELLFLERYFEWLRPGGSLLAVVPDSVLTNKGLFADLRAAISPLADIRSVVSLPPEAFAAAGTMTKTSVLHLRKREGARGSTFFFRCTDLGYTVGTRGSQRMKLHHGPGELQEAVALFADARLGTALTDGRSALASGLSDRSRWDAGYYTTLPPKALERVERPLSSDVSLADIGSIVRDKVDPRRSGDEHFSYIEISDVDGDTLRVSSKLVACADAPSRARKLVRTGDVLVSTVRPERRTVGVVSSQDDGAVCSTGFVVIRPTGIQPRLLAMLLQSPFVTAQLMRNNVGIAYPVVDESCFPSLLMPIDAASIEGLAAESRQVATMEQQLELARVSLEQGVDAASVEYVDLLGRA